MSKSSELMGCAFCVRALMNVARNDDDDDNITIDGQIKKVALCISHVIEYMFYFISIQHFFECELINSHGMNLRTIFNKLIRRCEFQ